jgi:hypothetical protein
MREDIDQDLIDESRQERFNNRHRRMLVDMRIRQMDPSERVSQDEIVDISEEE